MARSSMSSMAMLPPSAASFYSGIRPNFGQQPSVSQNISYLYISQFLRYLLAGIAIE